MDVDLGIKSNHVKKSLHFLSYSLYFLLAIILFVFLFLYCISLIVLIFFIKFNFLNINPIHPLLGYLLGQQLVSELNSKY